MRNRRKALLGAENRAFIIFKNEEASLRTGSLYTDYGKIEYSGGYIKIGNGYSMSLNYIINLDFTGFSKLHIVASTGSYGSTCLAHHSNYSDSYSKWPGKISIAKDTAKREYVFDISSVNGIRHIATHTANLNIYDIWLD